MANKITISNQEITITCNSCGVNVPQSAKFVNYETGQYIANTKCPSCGNEFKLHAQVIQQKSKRKKSTPAPKSKEQKKEISREIDTRAQIARLDMATGLAGIARPLKNGAKRESIDIRQSFSDWTMTFRGTALTDRDLGVLLAIISIAQQQRQQPNSKLQIGSEEKGLFQDEVDGVVNKIKPNEIVEGNNIANDRSVITVKTSYQKIREELGKKSSNSFNSNLILDSLHWLSSITVLLKQNNSKLWGITKLIHAGTGNEQSLSITLSCRLSEVVLGVAGSYGATDIKIYRNLDNSVSKILYVFLASHFGSFHEKRLGLNNMVKHVWSEAVEKLSKPTLKDRRNKIRQAILDIETVSGGQWTFEEGKDEVVLIKRKQLSGEEKNAMRVRLTAEPQPLPLEH